ncbi:MAG: hypothetical protein ABIC91_08155 [Nanoarchaeota archaeon]|nr:hypothetical protein [Nanoarchaeota archaeon]MBU1031059.1 hypothetical protein [Nanoarchaeota archaeon]MBU1850087.1 hypothetical protein [Nanoarchaeota archaeon]
MEQKQICVVKKSSNMKVSNMKVNKKLIEEVVIELVGEEALPIVFYLKGKKRISEFIIAEELDVEIHRTRNLLYRLYEHNIVFFMRRKDKIKGWYICYWDFNEPIILELAEKIRLEKIEKIKVRIQKEENNTFYMCKNACERMTFDNAIEHNFKCSECGQIMNDQDNTRTIEFLKERLKELNSTKEKTKKK